MDSVQVQQFCVVLFCFLKWQRNLIRKGKTQKTGNSQAVVDDTRNVWQFLKIHEHLVCCTVNVYGITCYIAQITLQNIN